MPLADHLARRFEAQFLLGICPYIGGSIFVTKFVFGFGRLAAASVLCLCDFIFPSGDGPFSFAFGV